MGLHPILQWPNEFSFPIELVRQYPWQCGISVLLLLLSYYVFGLLKMMLRAIVRIKVVVKIMKVLIIVRGSVKMMKAPGRGGFMIARAVFEGDPSGYFKALRGK